MRFFRCFVLSRFQIIQIRKWIKNKSDILINFSDAYYSSTLPHPHAHTHTLTAHRAIRYNFSYRFPGFQGFYDNSQHKLDSQASTGVQRAHRFYHWNLCAQRV